MDEGNCRRFRNFCKRIIYKLHRHFHDEDEADLQEALISVIPTNLANLLAGCFLLDFTGRYGVLV